MKNIYIYIFVVYIIAYVTWTPFRWLWASSRPQASRGPLRLVQGDVPDQNENIEAQTGQNF